MNLLPHLSLFLSLPSPLLCVDHPFSLQQTLIARSFSLQTRLPSNHPPNPRHPFFWRTISNPAAPISSLSPDWFSPFPFLPFTSLTEPPVCSFPIFSASHSFLHPERRRPSSLPVLSSLWSGGRLADSQSLAKAPRRSVIRMRHNREGSSSGEVEGGGGGGGEGTAAIYPPIHPSILEFNQWHTIGCHLLPDAAAGERRRCCHKPFGVRRLFKASSSSHGCLR